MAGTTFVLGDDEDDEPLMVVVARKRKAQAEEAAVQKAQVEKPKTRTKRGAKAKDAQQARVSAVKTECVEVSVQSVPPREPKKRGGKTGKTAAKAIAEAVKVEPAPDVAVAAVAKENTATSGKTKRSPRKKAATEAPADVLVPVISWGVPDSELVDTTTVQSTRKRQDKAAPKKTAAKKKTKKENKQTAPPTRSESQDTKTWRPPHTLAPPAAHLELGAEGDVGVKWDEKGFGCMELSALPWIAGVGYRAVEVRFEERDVLFGESRSSIHCCAELTRDTVGAQSRLCHALCRSEIRMSFRRCWFPRSLGKRMEDGARLEREMNYFVRLTDSW
ncbi:hypothetical protein C8T65DRAFT_730192 [Cerioporus squamosus]|nr:hypothetical protein C8T65DRAFT_730192 [Cerioporus squamosus]